MDLSDEGFDHPVVYDLKSMNFVSQQLPLMYNHRTTVGETERINNSKRDINGIAQINIDNRASKRIINAASKNEVEYEMSLGLDVSNATLKFMKNGGTVNGRTFDHPIYVIQNSLNDEVTITESGRDGNTRLRLLNSKISKGELMRIKNSSVKKANTERKKLLNKKTKPTPKPAPVKRVKNNLPPEEKQPTSRVLTAEDMSKILRLQNKYPKQARVIEEGLRRNLSVSRIHNMVKMRHLENQLPKPVKTKTAGSGPDLLEARLLNAVCQDPENTLKKHYGEKVRDQVMDMPQIGLKEFMVQGCHRLGKSFTGYSDAEQLIDFVTKNNRNRLLNMGFSSFDMPNMFERVTKFVLEESWKIEGMFAPAQCYETSNPDFKITERYRPTGGDMWDGLDADGKIKHGRSGKTKRYQTTLDTKAQILVFNRETIENDDMGGIREQLDMMAEGAMIVPDYKLLKHMLQANGSFFASNVNDFAGNNYTLTEPHLTTVYNAAQKQIIEKGRVNWFNRLGDIWQLVVGSADMERTAWEILNQSRLIGPTGSRAGDKNFWTGKLEIVTFNQLYNTTMDSGAQNDMWFLWPKGVKYAPFAITYLRGKKTPTVTVEDLPADMLGFAVRGYFDVEINDREPSAIIRCRPSGS